MTSTSNSKKRKRKQKTKKTSTSNLEAFFRNIEEAKEEEAKEKPKISPFLFNDPPWLKRANM